MRVISGDYINRVAAGIISAALMVWPAISAENAAPIPDLSGQWGRNMLNLEEPPSGPSPVINTMHKADGTIDNTTPVGDYANPILKSEAAEVVKARGEISLSGRAFPNPHNQCWPEPPPFVLAIQFGVQILQQKDEVILTYLSNHQVRHIPINVPHPAEVTPTWQGDSVGHYDGDTLIIDTLGIEVGPFSAVDRNGTPHSEALHVVERYRLIDGDAASEAALKHEALYNRLVGEDRNVNPYGRGDIDRDIGKKGLQVEITVEDPKFFTVPWSALVTYQPVIGDWPEAVCAENPRGGSGMDIALPTADKLDF